MNKFLFISICPEREILNAGYWILAMNQAITYSFFKFREPISENKISFTNDFVVDVRRYKNAVVNMYVHLYGKQYLPFSKEKTEFIHYYSRSDTSEYPIIESSIMIKENPPNDRHH